MSTANERQWETTKFVFTRRTQVRLGRSDIHI